MKSHRVVLSRALACLAVLGTYTSGALAQGGFEDGPGDQDVADHLMARLRAMGSAVFDDRDRDRDADEVARSKETAERDGSLLSARLRGQLEEAAPDDLLGVEARIAVPRVTRHIQSVSHTVAMEVVDGRLVAQWVDGMPATTEGVEQIDIERRALLLADQREYRTAVLEAWRELASRTRDPELRAQISILGSLAHANIQRLDLTPGEILELENVGADLGLRLEAAHPATNTVTVSEAGASLGLTAGLQYTGDDIGVWQSELGSPDLSLLGPGISIEDPGTSTDPLDINHATRMANILQTLAPDARIYYADSGPGCGMFGLVGTFNNPPAYVGSHSYAVPDQSQTYDNCDENHDEEIFSNRVLLFKGAGNINQNAGLPYVWSGPRARNVVAVGNANTTGDSSDCGPNGGGTQPANAMFCSSAWRDPSNYVSKPDIAAPGTDIVQTIGGQTTVASGTSEATAVAASLGAVMMDRWPALRGQPAMAKAMLLASARDFDGYGPLDSARDGYGLPNFPKISLAYAIGSDSGNWVGALGVTRQLSAGTTYRIVIAWLNSGSYAGDHPPGDPSSRWNLNVSPPCCGHPNYVVTGGEEGHKALIYTAPVSGNYYISMTRTQNNDTSVPSVLGIAIVNE